MNLIVSTFSSIIIKCLLASAQEPDNGFQESPGHRHSPDENLDSARTPYQGAVKSQVDGLRRAHSDGPDFNYIRKVNMRATQSDGIDSGHISADKPMSATSKDLTNHQRRAFFDAPISANDHYSHAANDGTVTATLRELAILHSGIDAGRRLNNIPQRSTSGTDFGHQTPFQQLAHSPRQVDDTSFVSRSARPSSRISVANENLTPARYPVYDHYSGPNPYERTWRNPFPARRQRKKDERWWKELEKHSVPKQFEAVLSTWENADYKEGRLLDNIPMKDFVENSHHFNQRFHKQSRKEKWRHQELGRWMIHLKQREWIWLDAIDRVKHQLEMEKRKNLPRRDQLTRLETFIGIYERRLTELRKDIKRVGSSFKRP